VPIQERPVTSWKGQGKGSIDAALKAVRGGKLDREVWIPFQLVTLPNMAEFENLN